MRQPAKPTTTLSLSVFQTNLKDGKYLSATTARRAVSKAKSFSAKDRDQARAQIDKHFGSAPAVAKVKAPRATAKASTKGSAGRKPGPRPRAPSEKAPRGPRRGRIPSEAAHEAEKQQSSELRGYGFATDAARSRHLPFQFDPHLKVDVAARGIDSLATALQSIVGARAHMSERIMPATRFEGIVAHTVEAIDRAVRLCDESIVATIGGEVAETTPTQPPSAGVNVPAKGVLVAPPVDAALPREEDGDDDDEEESDNGQTLFNSSRPV